MAAVTGTVRDVFGTTLPGGPKRDSNNKPIEAAIIDVTFAGTYASADDSSTAALNTALASARRDGRTYNVLAACPVAPGDLNGTKIFAGACTVSSNTMTAELKQADLTTEWANGALSTSWVEGIKFMVVFTATP